MNNELYVDGLGIASGVIDTIVSLSVAEVPGVAGVGTTSSINGLVARIGGGNETATGVEANVADGKLSIDITMQVFYGFRLTEVAAAVRTAVADACMSQIGLPVAEVNILVDGVSFAE